MNGAHRVLVAVDSPERVEAERIFRTLGGEVGGFKLGLELFVSHGPDVVRAAHDTGSEIFLDLKLHDIPNTMSGAAAAAGRLGASFLTVHALAGADAIAAAVRASAEGASAEGFDPPCVLAVTILTSHSDATLESIGVDGPCERAVVRLSLLAREAGAGGVVCSPQEIGRVREAFPSGRLVVPGIRPAGSSRGDQVRVATPGRAVRDGADRLVIGRPITRADDARAAARAIAASIDAEAASRGAD